MAGTAPSSNSHCQGSSGADWPSNGGTMNARARTIAAAIVNRWPWPRKIAERIPPNIAATIQAPKTPTQLHASALPPHVLYAYCRNSPSTSDAHKTIASIKTKNTTTVATIVMNDPRTREYNNSEGIERIVCDQYQRSAATRPPASTRCTYSS